MMATSYVGVDVSKVKLDVFLDGELREIPNEAKACRKLVKELAKKPGCSIVVEATGGYERTLAESAHAIGLPICVTQPRRVRSFAVAQGRIAKNDRLDAVLLAEFGNAVKPPPSPKPNALRETLREFVDLRSQLVEDRIRIQNRIATMRDKDAVKIAKKLLEQTIAAIEKADAKLDEIRKEDSEAKRVSDALESAAGVGKQVSAVLVAHLPELGQVNRQEIASLVGVAPFDRESGGWRGKRSIYGGRASVRRALYMATMVAAVQGHDKILGKTYETMVANGKPKKVAIIACARKLLVYLNVLARKALAESTPTSPVN